MIGDYSDVLADAAAALTNYWKACRADCNAKRNAFRWHSIQAVGLAASTYGGGLIQPTVHIVLCSPQQI